MVSNTFGRLTPAGTNAPALRPKPSPQHGGRALRTLLRFEPELSFAWVLLTVWASWGMSSWLIGNWQMH